MATIDTRVKAFEELAAKEWLVTNGIGGFAAGTLSGANTRRYHGMLVAAVKPPTHRNVLVSKVEETMVLPDGRELELSSNEFPGAIHPDGYRFLAGFERDPVPTFYYEAEKSRLTKRVCMVHGSNSTVLEYQNTGEVPFELKLRLFFNDRDYHHLTRENTVFNFDLRWKDDKACAVRAFPGGTPFYFKYSNGAFVENRDWYRQFLYKKETYRGLDDAEDLFTPGYIVVALGPQAKMHVCFSTDETILQKQFALLVDEAISRIDHLKKEALQSTLGKAVAKQIQWQGFDPNQLFQDLCVAADQFIVQRGATDGKTIIAGYHWFTDWGRDTMIAMRGLVIAREHKTAAENIIRTFLKFLDRGMIPNRFPDYGEEPEYNTIDATLWMFIVLNEYAAQFGDYTFIDEVFEDLTSIIEHHMAGTRYHIQMLDNGLLFGGEDGVQLTWMDAKVGDYVVTPRIGCAVEINALWYNALRIHTEFAEKLNQVSAYGALADKVKSSFHQYFFNGTHLNDVVIPGEFVDDAIRPNQLYAIGLPHSLLSATEGQLILNAVKNHLVTPYGLRSLAPEDPSFIGTYGGDQWHRDVAYHQGTVWSYLIGEYWLAVLKQSGYSEQAKRDVLDGMVPLLQHFYHDDCIHGINEIFDGLNPEEGRGCVQQAWSVGMMIRVISEVVRDNISGD